MNRPVLTTSTWDSPKPLKGLWDAGARRPAAAELEGAGRGSHLPGRRCPCPAAPPGLRPAPALRPGLPPRPRTVCECRLWLASTAAVSGTVSSSSTLPAGGFSMKAIPGRRRRSAESRGRNRRRPRPATRRVPPPLLSTRAAPRAAAAAAARGVLAPVGPASRQSTPYPAGS